jgi:ribosomal protein S27E
MVTGGNRAAKPVRQLAAGVIQIDNRGVSDDPAQASPPPDPTASLTANAGASEFRCLECNGRMEFDAAQRLMVCIYCSATRPVGTSDKEQSIVEYDLEHGLAKASARGYGVAVKTIACKQCGAVVSFGDSTTARDCDFCGSSQVLEQTESRNQLRPESVVPFQTDRKAASDKFSHWVGKLWFRPSNLKKLAKVSEMTGMYVPYWAFDADVHSDWTADAGHYYYVTETRTSKDAQGNTVTREEQVRKVRWTPAWGARDDRYDDLLVCGSKGLAVAMTRKLEPFDTKHLKPYDPSFLAGWKAEEYSVELNDAWKHAVVRIEQSQKQKCSGDVPGDTQRFLDVTNRFAHEKFKHVLLPIWISAYRYQGKPFQFLVNGQTGEVTGKAPWSVFKIVAFILLIVAIIVGIVLLANRK